MYVLLGVATLITIMGIIITILGFMEDIVAGIITLIGSLFIVALINIFVLSPILILDKSSGTTIGTITSVDRNYWGSTSIYIKTSETTQEKYCAEDNEIIKLAKENIGNEVKVSYGTRVGIYELKKCDQAPIEKIEKVDQ